MHRNVETERITLIDGSFECFALRGFRGSVQDDPTSPAKISSRLNDLHRRCAGGDAVLARYTSRVLIGGVGKSVLPIVQVTFPIKNLSFRNFLDANVIDVVLQAARSIGM